MFCVYRDMERKLSLAKQSLYSVLKGRPSRQHHRDMSGGANGLPSCSSYDVGGGQSYQSPSRSATGGQPSRAMSPAGKEAISSSSSAAANGVSPAATPASTTPQHRGGGYRG